VSIQAIKALVIALTALIVISLGLLVYGFMTRLSGPKAKADTAGAGVGAAAPPTGFGQVRMPLPTGCTVMETRPDGDRLYLRIGSRREGELSGSCEEILVFEAVTGRHLGTIDLRP